MKTSIWYNPVLPVIKEKKGQTTSAQSLVSSATSNSLTLGKFLRSLSPFLHLQSWDYRKLPSNTQATSPLHQMRSRLWRHLRRRMQIKGQMWGVIAATLYGGIGGWGDWGVGGWGVNIFHMQSHPNCLFQVNHMLLFHHSWAVEQMLECIQTERWEGGKLLLPSFSLPGFRKIKK